jgi:hypothetical protein
MTIAVWILSLLLIAGAAIVTGVCAVYLVRLAAPGRRR